MKICIVTEEFPPDTDWGGIASCFFNQAMALDEMGHSVQVITRALYEEFEYKIPNTNIRVLRIKFEIKNKILRTAYYKFPFGKLRKFLFKRFPEFMDTLEWIFFAYLKYRVLNKRKFDIIYTPEYHFCGLFISLLSKTPVVVYLNGVKIKTVSIINKRQLLDIKLINFFERLYVRLNRKRLIANSKSTALYIKKWSNVKDSIKVIHPFVFLEDFLKKNYSISITKDFILFVGRLEKRKGPDILLEAFIQIATKYPRVDLIFIGRDTPSFEYKGKYVFFKTLISKIVDRKIQKRVKVYNHMHKKRLVRYYSRCLFAAFPSRYEPFGMVVIEAMASAKAVIATRKGGPKEFIVRNKNGILVAPNVKEVKESLEFLIKNVSAREKMGKFARRTIEEKLDPRKLSKRLEDFYLKCLSR